MNSAKIPKLRLPGASEYLANALAKAHHATRKSDAEYDVNRDRVILKVSGQEITALGPREWFMSDAELQQKIDAAVLNAFGQGARPTTDVEI